MAVPGQRRALIFTDSDQFMAAQILDMAKGSYRYCSDAGVWLWNPDGTVWEVFSGDASDTIIAATVEKLPQGTKAAKGTPLEDMTTEERNYETHARLANSRSAAGIARKMKALAPASGDVATDMGRLDTDGSVIWAGGRPWDLLSPGRGLVVAERAVGAVHLKSSPYVPVLGPTPLWEQLTGAAFPLSDVGAWAEWELCSCCTTSNGKGLVHLHGVRDTAKTTVIRCIDDVLGSYSVQIPRPLLSGQQAHEGTVVRLAGARLAWFDEKPRRGQVAQEFLKELTGGGKFEARPPFGRGSVSGQFAATVVLASNDELPLSDGALLGRVRRVPMIGDPKATRAARNAIIGPDAQFTAAWRAEAPAVLGKLITLCARRMAGWTVEMPASAELELITAAAEQDSAGLFIATMLEAVEADQGSLAGELHTGYVNWCRDHGIGPADVLGLVPFGKRLTAIFGDAKRTRRGSAYPCKTRQPS